MPISLAQLNQSSQVEFVAALGDIFEQTPAIAAATWKYRPFKSIHELHQQMLAVVATLSATEQLALIQAHPDLGSKAKMADASLQEQATVGLNHLSATEYELFCKLNQRYQSKFGFPFIIAVKHHTKASILAVFTQRLENSVVIERQQALTEISEIARLRLYDCLTNF